MVSLRGSMSRFRWKPNPYRDQSNFCLQKRIWITIIILFILISRRRKQKLCKDGKTKKGEGRETCQMRLAIIIRWKLVHIQRTRGGGVMKTWLRRTAWYFSQVITPVVINPVQQGLASLNGGVSVSTFYASRTLMITLGTFLILVSLSVKLCSVLEIILTEIILCL